LKLGDLQNRVFAFLVQVHANLFKFFHGFLPHCQNVAKIGCPTGMASPAFGSGRLFDLSHRAFKSVKDFAIFISSSFYAKKKEGGIGATGYATLYNPPGTAIFGFCSRDSAG
jgi:hypothetical protein